MRTHLRSLSLNDGGTLLLIGAILVGSIIGLASDTLADALGSAVDRTVLLLIVLLALEIPLTRVRLEAADVRFVFAAWTTNFLVIPPVGFLFASLFLAGEPLMATGVFIYFLAPCTDWFLGFTRLARGNTSLGALLIPINMATQLALYPVYLAVFTRWHADLDLAASGDTIVQWFVVPVGAAVLIRLGLAALRTVQPRAASIPARLSSTTPLVIAILVVEIFASNSGVIVDHLTALVRILVAVMCFFALTWFAAERISRAMHFAYAEHVLFTFTTAARNAPLMLGVTVVAIPDQPLVYAALVIGMLVEFPHLTVLKHLLLRHRPTSETRTDGRPVVETRTGRQGGLKPQHESTM
jgi:ACR3 family arsenite efflux pump ArsB